MFLSQLTLNSRNTDVHRDLASPYEMHRTLMRAFPNQTNGGAGRVLFRVESLIAEDAEPTVIVQSEHQPNWTDLQDKQYAVVNGPKRIGYSAEKNGVQSATDAVQITNGDRFRFRLVANPTVKRKVEGRKNGRRDACVTDEQQHAWLVRKGETSGFRLATIETDDDREVPNVTVIPTGRITTHRKKDKRTLSHHGVRFDGILHVTDAEKFAQALAAGIGSAKAFGFGLLSIARA